MMLRNIRKWPLHVKDVCNNELWDKDWFIRGITKNGKKIGTSTDKEGKVHLESNAWAVLSGAASEEKGIKAMDSVKEYLATPYGIMLNAPSYTVPDDDIGFITRVYPGVQGKWCDILTSKPMGMGSRMCTWKRQQGNGIL